MEADKGRSSAHTDSSTSSVYGYRGLAERLESRSFRRFGAAILALATLHVGSQSTKFFHQDKSPTNCADIIGQKPVHIGNTSEVSYFGGIVRINKDTVRRNIPGVNDGISWTDQANSLSSDRGYHISTRRLELANSALGDIDLSKRESNAFCMEVPGPVIAGWIEADEKKTVQEIADENLMSIKDLVAKNPGISLKPEYTPRLGMIIDVSNESNIENQRLVERQSPYEKINDIEGITPISRLAILRANQFEAGEGTIDKGDLLKLPLIRTNWMKENNITTQQIIDTYATNYNSPNVAGTSNPNLQTDIDTTKFEYSLNSEQIKLIDNLEGLTDKQKQFIKDVYPIILGRTQAGYHWNPEAIMAMAISETSWGQSEGAIEGNNLFGVKAGSNWNGQTTSNNGTEQNPDGTYTPSTKMVWRKYNTFADSVDDYGKFLGDGTRKWARDALACTQTAEEFLNGIQYKLDTRSCKKFPGQSKPGDLELSHATDHLYVEKILEIIHQFKLEDIRLAGPTFEIKSLQD